MEIIAWDPATDTAVEPERSPNDGEWARYTEGKRVLKRQYHPQPATASDSKFIDMGRLAELLPDSVILELEDFKANTGETAAKRKAVARVLLIIASGRQWDVYGTDYDALMTKLKNNTTLTATNVTDITNTLKG